MILCQKKQALNRTVCLGEVITTFIRCTFRLSIKIDAICEIDDLGG